MIRRISPPTPYLLNAFTVPLPMMQTTGTLTFAAEGQDTVMSWDWQDSLKGWLRLLGPLSGPLGGRMERRIWTGLKHQLEDDARAHPA